MHESLEWVFNEFRRKKDVQNLNKTLSDIWVDGERDKPVFIDEDLANQRRVDARITKSVRYNFLL